MEVGDLVAYSLPPDPFRSRRTRVGVLLSTRTTKWDPDVTFYTFLTSEGVEEVILGVGSRWEVVS